MGKRGQHSGTTRKAGESLYDRLVNVTLTGIAIVLPLVVTVYVLAMAIEFVAEALTPVVKLLEWTGVVAFLETLWITEFLLELGIYGAVFDLVAEFIAVLTIVAAIIGIGALAHVRYGERLVLAVDAALAGIPGVGTVYKSFRRVGDAMLESDAENFEDVKLVEYPREGSYVLGFETAHSPDPIAEAAGADELVALFLPFAPNPVMGGYLAHIPEDRVYDVDMTVEEGIRTIITTGIAAGEDGESASSIGDIPGVKDDGPATAD